MVTKSALEQKGYLLVSVSVLIFVFSTEIIFQGPCYNVYNYSLAKVICFD